MTSFQLPYVLDAESILSICLWANPKIAYYRENSLILFKKKKKKIAAKEITGVKAGF